jgi:hypothetical protein
VNVNYAGVDYAATIDVGAGTWTKDIAAYPFREYETFQVTGTWSSGAPSPIVDSVTIYIVVTGVNLTTPSYPGPTLEVGTAIPVSGSLNEPSYVYTDPELEYPNGTPFGLTYNAGAGTFDNSALAQPTALYGTNNLHVTGHWRIIKYSGTFYHNPGRYSDITGYYNTGVEFVIPSASQVYAEEDELAISGTVINATYITSVAGTYAGSNIACYVNVGAGTFSQIVEGVKARADYTSVLVTAHYDFGGTLVDDTDTQTIVVNRWVNLTAPTEGFGVALVIGVGTLFCSARPCMYTTTGVDFQINVNGAGWQYLATGVQGGGDGMLIWSVTANIDTSHLGSVQVRAVAYGTTTVYSSAVNGTVQHAEM